MAPLETREVRLTDILPDPAQPRQEFAPDVLHELQQSIAEHGVLSPITVVPRPDDTYQIVSGERRWRAAQVLGLATVPCHIQPASDWQTTLALQVAENLHRQDLTPLELAQSLWRAILAANIAAFVDADGGDAEQYIVPAADASVTVHIQQLEATLARLAAVETAQDYFAAGRVRVGRKAVLERLGFGSWSAQRVRRLLATLHVAPAVQDFLAGVDVPIAMLHELADHDPATQHAIAEDARTRAAQAGQPLTEALRATLDDHTENEDVNDIAPPSTFVADPSLALLTSEPHAPTLITDRPAPERGTTPPVAPVGVMDADLALQVHAACETLHTMLLDVGVLRCPQAARARIAPLWQAVCSLMEPLLHDAA